MVRHVGQRSQSRLVRCERVGVGHRDNAMFIGYDNPHPGVGAAAQEDPGLGVAAVDALPPLPAGSARTMWSLLLDSVISGEDAGSNSSAASKWEADDRETRVSVEQLQGTMDRHFGAVDNDEDF